MPGMGGHSLQAEGPSQVPPWVQQFLAGHYFVACQAHAAAHKSERNFFCIDCGGESLCTLCVAKYHSGPGHTVLQVRRSSYHEVVRVLDIRDLLDTSQIQIYVINSAKIVFLNGRPQARPVKGAPYSCETCHRTLQDAFRFCSIGCKLAAVAYDAGISLQPRTQASSLGSSRGHVEASTDMGAKRSPSQPFRPLPPLLMEEGSSQEVSMEDSGKEVDSLVDSSYPSKKKKFRSTLTSPDMMPQLVLLPSPLSPLEPRTPPQCSLDIDQRLHRRKGVPHRAPLF